MEAWKLVVEGSCFALPGFRGRLRPTPRLLSFKREDDGREGAVSGEAAERPALAHLASRALASLREKKGR